MNKHGLTKENLVVTLPPALRTDPSVVALAEALSELLAARPAEIERLRIYPAIDTLEEPLLDILARDFKVDWWDPEYSLEEKRRTLKDSWRVHRLLGTRAAVETAISAIYPHTQILEWFEYGGQPYCFKVRTDAILTEGMADYFSKMIRQVKNARSHIDSVEIHRTVGQEQFAGTGLALQYRQAAIIDGYNIRRQGSPKACVAVAGAQNYRPAAIQETK